MILAVRAISITCLIVAPEPIIVNTKGPSPRVSSVGSDGRRQGRKGSHGQRTVLISAFFRLFHVPWTCSEAFIQSVHMLYFMLCRSTTYSIIVQINRNERVRE